MRGLWTWVIRLDIAAALVFCFWALVKWNPRKRNTSTDQSRALTLKSKPVIVGFLVTLTVLFVVSLVFYGFAFPPGYFTCMARPVLLDYGSFAFPCIAGILAGGGFIYGKTQEEIDKSIDLRFYLASVFFLVVAFASFIVSHPRPVVIVFVSLAGATAAIFGLGVSFIARVSWKPSEKTKSRGDDQQQQIATDGVGVPEALTPPQMSSAERREERLKILNGTPVNAIDGFAFMLFTAMLFVQLLVLTSSTVDPSVSLRTTEEDPKEQQQCDAEHTDSAAKADDQKNAVAKIRSGSGAHPKSPSGG